VAVAEACCGIFIVRHFYLFDWDEATVLVVSQV
jgi:hypothetical protein